MSDSHGDETVRGALPAPRVPLADRRRLSDALGAVKALHRPHVMQEVLRELTAELGGDFHPPGDTDASQPAALMREAIRLGAARQLVDVLKLVIGKDRDIDVLAELVEAIVPRFSLTDSELETLDSALIDLAPQTLAAIAQLPNFELPDNISRLSLRDILTHLDESTDMQGRLRLITFLETVAHQVDAFGSRQVHAVIDKIVLRFALDIDVRGLCQGTVALSFDSSTDDRNATTDDINQTQPEKAGGDDSTAVTSGGAQQPHGDDMRSTSLTTTPELVSITAPAIMGGVPPRNPNFVGRRDVLDHLAQTLARHGQAAVLPTTLRGLGGIGKSQLAAEFARRYQGSYQLIWWIPAENARSIRRSFVSLARRLEIPQSEDVQNTVETVLDRLRSGNPFLHWLLIFDDAADPAIVTPYLPGGPGQVLISSRLRSWHSASETIELDVFSPDESVELLTSRWEGLTSNEALDLAGRLGHLPLALDQAAAVHAESGMPLQEYLRHLESSPAQILDEGDVSQYPTSLAKTWQLAFEQLSEHSPAASQLLEVCAFLSSNPIAIPMIIRGRGADLPSPLAETMRDDLKMRRAVGALGRFALAQLDVARDFIKIHMLVRAVLRDKMDPERRTLTERAAQDLLAHANPGDPDRQNVWSQHAQIAPHVQSSGAVHSEDAHVRKIVLDQIRYQFMIGDYQESRDLATEALSNWRNRLGPDDEMTLLASFHLGNALRALGDYRGARETNQDTLDRMKRTFEPGHEYTLRCASSTAADFRLLGEFSRALAIDTENVQEATEALGETDPSTLKFVNNLAIDHRLLGDFTTAKILDEVNSRRAQEVFGEAHPSSLTYASNLARDLYGTGDYATALQQVKALLPHAAQVRGSTSLLVRRNHVILLRATGQYGSALDEAQRLYDDSDRLLGKQHEHSMAAATTLFNTLRLTGDLKTAEKLGASTLDAYTGAFGADHPFTLACAADLAAVHRARGEVTEAYDLDRRTLSAFDRVLSPDHPHTLACAANLAVDLALLGRAAEAYEQSDRTYRRSERVRGAAHPYTLYVGANLVLDLEGVRRHEDAAELRAQIMPVLRNVLGSEHPEVVNIERGRRAESIIEVPPT